MAETEQVIITIGDDGAATVEVKCGHGKSCTDLTKQIEQALGATTGDKKKQEYYEQENKQTARNTN